MSSARHTRRLRRARATLLVSTLCAAACGGAQRTHMDETIAGVVRTRTLASPTAYDAFLRAEIAVTEGRYDVAARQLELAEVADPSDPYLVARRAEVLVLARNIADAVEVAQQGTRRFPRAAAVWIALAEALSARLDLAGVTAALSRAIECAPDDPEVRASVARVQGAGPRTVADAMEHAPGARAGDRVTAQRMALDPGRDDRPTLRSVRIERARRAWARGAWAEVDGLLTPLVDADRTAVSERVRVIEARVRDGRVPEAARLVAGLMVSSGSGGVSAVVHARLWTLVGRPELAIEEAAPLFRAAPGDDSVRMAYGEALVHGGSRPLGIATLAGIPPSSPRFAEAQILAAEALGRVGQREVSDAVLRRAVDAVPAEDAAARDRLRLARATLAVARGDLALATEAARGVETPLGRQRRGVLFAPLAPTAAVVADLRVRSGEAYADGIASSALVLVCARANALCAAGEADRAMDFARANAPAEPNTLRARAVRENDLRRRAALLREAHGRDPLSAWDLPPQAGAQNGMSSSPPP